MKSLKTQRGKSKDRLHNDQKIKGERTNNDLQNNSQKTKDRATLKKRKSDKGTYVWSLVLLKYIIKEL
jgi:hypothetical protein